MIDGGIRWMGSDRWDPIDEEKMVIETSVYAAKSTTMRESNQERDVMSIWDLDDNKEFGEVNAFDSIYQVCLKA